jgi:hypothetical protein
VDRGPRPRARDGQGAAGGHGVDQTTTT